MNYCELLFDGDQEYQNNEVLIDADNGRRLTYKELKGEVRRVAVLLRSQGYQPGTVIATHLYNSVEAAVALLAIQYIGGVICLVDPLFKPNEVAYYIKDSGAKCLITYLQQGDIEPGQGLEFDLLNVKALEEGADSTDYAADEDFHSYNENDLAMLLYTSGSTSTPKGVMLTTGCFFTFIEKSNKAMYRYNPDDRALCFVPFSHGFGSVSLLIPILVGKAAIVFLRSFQPTKIANAIAEENITHIFGVPTHYQQLLRYESIYDTLKKLKYAFSAAAPLSYETSLAWYKAIGVYLDEGFGMSECTTLISTRMSMLPKTTGDVGFPPEGILKVDAVDDNGQVCDHGVIGELRVTGRGIMLGYLNRPKETAERLKDGALYTGDLGYTNSDGSVVICGRKTEFINVAGLKISPIEIESALNEHEYVIDSAAVGIEDGTYGEIVKAFVILKDNVEITERELIRFLSGKIANFKVPKYITVLKEFPMNNLGKVDKKALKKL